MFTISKMKPVVSVVIPTYNCADLLERSIKSVLGQTFQDFEIIVVDDGSSDNTKEIVSLLKDERIKYVNHKKNQGEAAARNTGIKIAQGEYIASQDSDDEWLPEKLEKQINVFKKSPADTGVVYTGFWKIAKGKKLYFPSSNIKKKEGNIHNIILKANFIGTPTTLIKKECFEKAGLFDERLFHLVDWELWIRISRFYNFKYIDEPLVNSYYREQCVCANFDAFLSARELILEKHFKEIEGDKRLLAYHAYILGSEFHKMGDINKGRKYILQALLAYPVNIKYLFAFLVSKLAPLYFKKFSELKKIILFKQEGKIK